MRQSDLNRPCKYLGWAFGLVALMLAGCGSHSEPSHQTAREKTPPAPASAQPSFSDLADAMDCLADELTAPQQSFHYSFKRSEGGWTHQVEADFTPDSVEGRSTHTEITTGKPGVTNDVNAKRADAEQWNAAVRPIAIISHNFGMKDMYGVRKEGGESMNGYDTTKYSFNSAYMSVADQAAYARIIGAKDYGFMGNAWVSNDRKCMVKFDSTFHENALNGNTVDDHIEVSFTKR